MMVHLINIGLRGMSEVVKVENSDGSGTSFFVIGEGHRRQATARGNSLLTSSTDSEIVNQGDGVNLTSTRKGMIHW